MRQRLPALKLLGLGSAAVLLSAFALEYMFKAPPCTLCIYQRVPYALVVGLVLLHRVLPAKLLLALVLVLAVVSAGLAGYHVGVEQKWWLYACSSSAGDWMTANPVRCDTPIIQLFGVSLAMVNMILSAVTAVVLARFYWVGQRL